VTETAAAASALPEAFWLPEGNAFRATAATRGPWSMEHQHGGPPAALLARALELDAATSAVPLRAARITVLFHRPIAIDVFRVSVEPVREGKKVRIARAYLTDLAGRAVATAEALFVRRADVGVPATVYPSPRAPEECAAWQFPFFTSAVGYHTAMETRLLAGTFGTGKMALWMRMRVPVVPGESPSGLQRVVCAADSGNGTSVGIDVAQYTFLNPDLTVHLARELQGEWVALDATTHFGDDGIALAESALLDGAGFVGRGLQTLVVERRASS
jgi:acyl-coenzyme A thioesterase PaaI-like protein